VYFAISDSFEPRQLTEMDKLKSLAAQRNMMVVNVAADGNCLFSSLARQLTQLGRGSSATATTAHDVRMELVECLQSHSQSQMILDSGAMTEQELQVYIDNMKKCGTWGDGVILSVAVNLYRRPIIILTVEGEQRIDMATLPTSSQASSCETESYAIYLGLVGTNHYVSIEKQNSQHTAESDTNISDDECGTGHSISTSTAASNSTTTEEQSSTSAQLTCSASTISVTASLSPAGSKPVDVKVDEFEEKVHEAIEFQGVVQSSKNQSGRKQKVEAEHWAEYRSEARGGSGRRRIVHCKICCAHPDLVKIHCQRIPAICTANGAVFRQQMYDEHCGSTVHNACLTRSRQQKALAEGRIHEGETVLEKQLRFANTALEQKIARIMIKVYMDAKRGTLSAWSFPARYVASLMAERLDLNNPEIPFSPTDTDLQYVTPASHRDMLLTIAETDRKAFALRFKDILALSLRVDGAVDKQRIDNKHVMAQVVTAVGDMETWYMGLAESEKRGSEGLLEALRKASAKCGATWPEIFKQTTSIVTDGASENTGRHHSLWTLLEQERKDNTTKDTSSPCKGPSPLLKIWCSVHRSQLVFKDMTTGVPEARRVIDDCKAVTRFYNSSACRTKEFKKHAEELGVTVRQYPSVIDIRFTQYSNSLLSSILDNYRPMMRHLQTFSLKDAEEYGMLKKWINADTVHIAAILCDALYIYSRFQKKLQGNQVTLFDVESDRDKCVEDLRKLLQRPHPGGYEEKVTITGNEEQADEVIKSYDTVKLTVVQLRHCKREHSLVSSCGRDVYAIKTEIICSLCNFLTSRLGTDKGASDLRYALEFQALSPPMLLNGNASDEDIERVYTGLASDFAKRDFYSSYGELVNAAKKAQMSNTSTLQDFLKISLTNADWRSVSVAVARLLAAKPHSCDVERLVSAYNLMKDDDRSSLNAETVDAHLHVRMNMPVTSKFDVRPALRAWLQACNRRSRPTVKAKSQEWFKDVF